MPIAGVASFLCAEQYSKPFFPTEYTPLACGNISFWQWDYPDHRPVHVYFALENLQRGEYLSYIHFFGDITDHCKQKAGQVYHTLKYFNVTVCVRVFEQLVSYIGSS